MEHPYSEHDRSTATHTVRRNYHTRVRPPQAIASPGIASIETDVALLMDLLIYGIAAALIALGLADSVCPCCRAFHLWRHLAHRRHRSLTAVVMFAVSLLESRRTAPTAKGRRK
jgi:hypothetical protein